MIHPELLHKSDVQVYPLGDLGYFYGGLSGKSKEDFVNGNMRFIPYMNIFSNLSIDTDNLGMVKVEPGERQNVVEYGDFLFTASSETPDECGMSSVMLEKTDWNNPIFLNSFCFGFRFTKVSMIYPPFYKHLFRSYKIRKAISRTANGVTRFNISKKAFARIPIPVPPIDSQRVLADKLDSFTTLITELDEEIELRKQQLEHYRNILLDLRGMDNIDIMTLGQLGSFTRGNGIQKSDFVEDGKPCIHYGQVHTCFGISTDKAVSHVTESQYKKCKKAKFGDIILATTSEDVEAVCKPVAWLGQEEVAVSTDAFIYSHQCNPIFMANQFLTDRYFKFKASHATGAKVIRISDSAMRKYEIYLPSLDKQNEIANCLTSFTQLISKLEEERDLRQKQYEYYREKLLTFE